MSVIRSVSTSELTCGTVHLNDISTMDRPLGHDSCQSHSPCENEGMKTEFGIGNDSLIGAKTQTLDRFIRPSTMNPQGEKRKKSFFASFRLSKKSFGKGKDDQGSSGSDVSQTPEKPDATYNSNLSHLQPTNETRKGEEESGLELPPKSRKHYLNRMSSFVNRVASRVQVGELNSSYGLRNKLERSQTVTGTDLMSAKVDFVSFDENQVPGLIGIRNHGNTCFINAVIQCLSHTDVLAEYFVLDQYKNDLARCNRINSKKFGTRGEITEHFASLLKSLWVLRYVPDISLNLKNIVEKYEPCYRGSNQHDAAEFLMFILDKVHEDLNTASKRKYKKVKNSYGRPDEIVAAETLANHLRCNSSFIQDIFQAQFRSSLKCPHCLKESNTFDPYLCVSIPIPQKEVLPFFVTVVYLNQQPKQVKIGVSIEAFASIKQLRSLISIDCGIPLEQLILTEIDGEGFHRTFADNTCVNIIKSTDPIYAVELTAQNSSESENDGFLHITWMNVLIAEPSNIRFGGVYQSQIARDVTYSDLQKLLLKEMTAMVTVDTLISEQKNGVFRIGIDSGTKDISLTLEPDLDLPLLHQNVDDALSICHPSAGPPHIKLVLQWTVENKEKYITDDVDHIEEHSTVEELRNKVPEYAPVTLSDCLQLHTSAEMLSCGDAWHCPTCNRKQQVLKRLNLWSAPQVLVIHLKRFKQVSLSTNSSKLNTVVTFPLTGFDISDHMASRHCSQTIPSNALDTATANKVLGGVWSPWKRPKKFNFSENEHIYDLYAICNHHGRDLQGGHYTAVCRNPTNGRWYAFDDFTIEEVPQEDVAGQDAYILFYQKREVPLSPYCTEEIESRHWAYRIPISVLPSSLKIIPNSICTNKDSPASEKSAFIDEIPTNSKDGVKISPMQVASAPEIISSVTENSTSPLVSHQTRDAVMKESRLEEPRPSFLSVGIINSLEAEQKVTSAVSNTSKIEDEDRFIHASNQKKIEFLSNCLDVQHNPTKDPHPSKDSNSKALKGSTEDKNQEVIPDVRIQPASLEVLASHKYLSCPANQSIIKVTLRPKTHNDTSRPSSSESFSSKCVNASGDSSTMNGYGSEHGSSSCDEETPQIRINSPNPLIPNSYQNKTCHRMSNANKTPSFVVIRTPTSSPRNIREKPASNGTSKYNGNWRPKARETYPGQSIAPTTKEKRPLSYSAGQTGKACISEPIKRPLNVEKYSNGLTNGHSAKGTYGMFQRTNGHAVKSTYRDCEKSGGYTEKSTYDLCEKLVKGHSAKATYGHSKTITNGRYDKPTCNSFISDSEGKTENFNYMTESSV